ncbi:hypothetical protein P691DRAFT_778101 [Macrolepiota fuliginosa MF-IS2]|uniref:Nephrocystin 3-like N-terminal domain-containing protein n=1 Tax=Macrolepiota fuliginosa MF-IS2 TaxID=1400762 RepID=A0A9P5X4G9_9AGAR|nr:hypothetical protein P691DRAFT_778101 [Macrolepiota fuliginosa MF-IS2]
MTGAQGRGTLPSLDQLSRRIAPNLPPTLERATLFSHSRRPLPRCLTGTRTHLIEEIMDESKDHNILWVNGPAGAGKTALAQTIGELAHESEFLGAAFFFSRAQHCDKPSLFWTSIARQVAFGVEEHGQPAPRNIRQYHRTLLELGIRAQFDTFFYRLLCCLQPSEKLIIIDGLDECTGEKTQCEIIECICDTFLRQTHLPLRWMIFSRPEAHLKRAFEAAEAQSICWVKEIVIDDPDTLDDIRLYLEDGFKRIAQQYRDIPEKWPAQDEFDKIFYTTSGLFVIAATFLRFIGDPLAGNPISQLKEAIAFLAGTPGAKNPLDYVDNMYREIVKRSTLLPVTLQVLGACAVCYMPLPVLYFSHLIGLNLQRVQDALLSLHSIIAVPPDSKVTEESLHYFHASFAEFLIDPDRARDLAQDLGACGVQFAKACFDVLCDTEISYAQSLPSNLSAKDIEVSSPLSISYHVSKFAATSVWGFCIEQMADPPDRVFFRHIVDTFDFRRLKAICEMIPALEFIIFLKWLHLYTIELLDLPTFVRTYPLSNADTRFIQAFEPLSVPLYLHGQLDEKELELSPRYAMVGFPAQTVAILVTHETVMVYFEEDIHTL